MGLRPSIKKDENDTGKTLLDKSQSNAPPSQHGVHVNNSPNGGDSLPASPTTTHREAWTARGQILLNFHHAISRAINSPEMMRKCSQIAEDASFEDDRRGDAGSDGRPASKSSPSSAQKRRPSMGEEYGAEAAMIVEGKARRDAAVRNKSLAVGLFSLVALRSGRGLASWMRNAISNARRSSYRFESHLRPSGTASLIKEKEIAGGRSLGESKHGKLRTLLRAAVDITISTTIALLSGAFLFTPRPSAYIEDMSKLPLVRGKSVYAEMVCPPLIDEYRRVLEEYGGRWPVRGAPRVAGDNTGPELTQEDVSLNVIRKFVENCSRRSSYERALIEERNALSLDSDRSTTSTMAKLMRRITRSGTDNSPEGIGDEKRSGDVNKLGTISVPSPGVPENIPVNLDQAVLQIGNDGNYEEGSGENGKR